MMRMFRRTALGGLAAVALAPTMDARAQGVPVKIELLSDVGGLYQDNGGIGNKIAAEMAVADFGGRVLGRPLQVLQLDDQNKADVATSLARQWIDNDDVSLLLDGASSVASLAIQQVSRERRRVYCTTSSIATALVGKQCSPYYFQFMANAYSYAKGVGGTLTAQGNDTWFFIAVDNEAGTSLQSGTEQFVTAGGGRILGSLRAPVGTTDFSSFLLQAQASRAKVVCFANAGTDLQNCIKQAAEFGIVRSGQLLATVILEINDVVSLGQDVCQGLVVATSFYWNMTPETRAWTARYVARMGKPPSSGHACAYSSTLHWLKAVQATGTLDADAVAARMRATPVDDFFNDGVRIMASGSVPHTTYVWIVKPSAEATARWDVFKLLATLPSPQAFPAAEAFGCPLAKA